MGALLFVTIVIALFIWYRRKLRLHKNIAAQREGKRDVPAPAETVLNRPDPIEKPPTEHSTVRVYSVSSNTTIDLDPESQRTPPSNPNYNPTNVNPFDDATSIQTAGTEGTNVIPITLVSPDIDRPPSETTTSTFPVRPPRSPELNLNLDHVNISGDSIRGNTPYAASQRSGVSGFSSRNSFMSNASFSSDFLNEAPMIITPTRGAVRQVLGVVKAEVIKTPGSLSPSNSSEGLKPPLTSRPSVGSPLASTSFGPADVVKEPDETQLSDPFGDEASAASAGGNHNAPSVTSVITFGHSSTGAVHDSHSDWVAETPNFPWSRSTNDSRPSSTSTQSGSVVNIASAKRVNVGLSPNDAHGSDDGTPHPSYRTTVGRLVSPAMPLSDSLYEQQQRALAHAQARAQAQGAVDQNKRLSGSSVLSGASTRADSILESFPFVPPSPISNRPVRSPPVSPLGQQSFSGPPSPLSQQHAINISPPTPHVQQIFSDKLQAFADEALPPPPDRRMLGLSTASQLSTSSSGLGSFPFQIDSGSGIDNANVPSAFNGRQRASLDTLALTSDLSSYPLGFDRESVQVPRKP